MRIFMARSPRYLSAGDVASLRQAPSGYHRRMHTVTRLSDAMGAEVRGLDLAQALTPALKEAILAAFREHHLLVFRDQTLTGEQQHALTLSFGEIEGHVGRSPDGTPWPLVHLVHNLDAQGHPTADPDSIGNYFWHTD